jgi:hypothetical protein
MLKARPKEPAVLVVGLSRSAAANEAETDRNGASRAAIVMIRRPSSRVIFASSNAGVILAHRGESCRPGVVSTSPDIRDVVRRVKASGSEAEGLSTRLRWGSGSCGPALACSRSPGRCRMPHWRTRHVACDARQTLTVAIPLTTRRRLPPALRSGVHLTTPGVRLSKAYELPIEKPKAARWPEDRFPGGKLVPLRVIRT